MKIKILASALIFAFTILAIADTLKESQIKPIINDDKIEVTDLMAFNLGHNVTKPTELTDSQTEEIELSLQKLLDECSDLIGPQDDDQKLGVNLKRAVYIVITGKGWDEETLKRIQPSYLVGRLEKCYRYVLKDPSNLNSFEYENSLVKNDNYHLVEDKYEIIYLTARSKQFLHKLRQPSVPKSLIREYANESGLTKFILAAEVKAGKQLKHDELAAIYFGSKRIWQEKVIQFLNQKTEKLNIGK